VATKEEDPDLKIEEVVAETTITLLGPEEPVT
jgi:hypothetical protein